MKRKLCRMRRGCSASARGRRRSFGQMYRIATIPHAMKPNAMLTKKQSCGRILGSSIIVSWQVWYPLVPRGDHCGTMWYRLSRETMMTRASLSKELQEDRDETEVRPRTLDAAFSAFMKNGYAATSTLEIATRARVSKREIYALVGNKQQMLIACISARARRLQVPADLPVPNDRETFAHILASFGTQLVREITDPT